MLVSDGSDATPLGLGDHGIGAALAAILAAALVAGCAHSQTHRAANTQELSSSAMAAQVRGRSCILIGIPAGVSPSVAIPLMEQFVDSRWVIGLTQFSPLESGLLGNQQMAATRFDVPSGLVLPAGEELQPYIDVLEFAYDEGAKVVGIGLSDPPREPQTPAPPLSVRARVETAKVLRSLGISASARAIEAFRRESSALASHFAGVQSSNTPAVVLGSVAQTHPDIGFAAGLGLSCVYTVPSGTVQGDVRWTRLQRLR